jgi:hypothetical protein
MRSGRSTTPLGLKQLEVERFYVYAVGRIPPVQLVARVAAMPLRYREMDIDLELRTETLYFLESRRPA